MEENRNLFKIGQISTHFFFETDSQKKKWIFDSATFFMILFNLMLAQNKNRLLEEIRAI